MKLKHFLNLDVINFFVASILFEKKTEFYLKNSDNKVVIVFPSKFKDTLTEEPWLRIVVLVVSSDFAHVNQMGRNQHYRVHCVGRITGECDRSYIC